LFNTALAFSFVFIISISIYANIFFVIQETSRLDFSKNYENSTQIQKDTKGENDIQSAETPAVSEEYLEDKVLETNEKDSN
jgi:hypothetical protein